MKKLLLLLAAPLFLVGCNSNPATSANYLRLQSYQIFGGGQASNSEPVYYIFAEYELAQPIEDTSYNSVYGDAKKTIYVVSSFASYEKSGFKSQAQVSIYNSNTGTTTTSTATHKGNIVKVKNATELYYAVEIRTIKHVQYSYATEKVFNESKLKELKSKYFFSASLTDEATTISISNYYGYNSYFTQSTVETYIDLGTTAVSYVPYTPPEN